MLYEYFKFTLSTLIPPVDMDGIMLVGVEEDADSQILTKFRHDIYQMEFKQETHIIITT